MANLTREDSMVRGFTDSRKVLIAWVPWKTTPVSQAWIAEHLSIKNACTVSSVIHHMDFSQLQGTVSGNLKRLVSQKMQ